jgi:predicted nucleotidyltransferase component of viral defense system
MENNINLKKIILEISNDNYFNTLIIEKDFYLTKFLIALSDNKITNLVFKGGTCLNKCYLGFYRLSEDLDFIFNESVSDLTNRQLKIKTEDIRTKLNLLLEKKGFSISNDLGKGWKKITQNHRIINLVIFARYRSIISDKFENIKIDVSFRNKLYLKTKYKIIKHLFYDKLNNPLLEYSKKIECIDICENLAEKYRALVTRHNIAIRDIYDIGYIINNKKIELNNSFLNLILKKIRESKNITKIEFLDFIDKLSLESINISPLEVVLATNVNAQKEIIKMLKLTKTILNI